MLTVDHLTKLADQSDFSPCKALKYPAHGWRLVLYVIPALIPEIEVAEEQVPATLNILKSLPELVTGEPSKPNGALIVAINQRESIPDVLNCLVQNHTRVYRIAPQEANLEQVYFTLHDEKEGV